MRILALSGMLVLSSLFMSHNASAQSCKPEFKSHVRYLLNAANGLSRPCWREVDKGEANRPRIQEVCDREMNTVWAMKSHKDQMRSLCYTDGCQPELNKAKLCLPGKKLAYYKRVLGL